MPGWKFAEYEMKGVPLRLEIGPRDLENNQCVAVRRDSGEKTTLSLDNLASQVSGLLDQIHEGLLEKARKSLESRIFDARDWETFASLIAGNPGFVRAMWCGDLACELKIKEQTTATSRCMPFEQEAISDTCVCCGQPADKLVIWGKAY
jgi:prolyl-tRNA synthetase